MSEFAAHRVFVETSPVGSFARDADLHVIGDATDPQLIQHILEHLRAKAPPRAGPARAERAPSDSDLLSPA